VYYSLICSAIFITVIISEYSLFLAILIKRGVLLLIGISVLSRKTVHISLIDIVIISIALKSVKFQRVASSKTNQKNDLISLN